MMSRIVCLRLAVVSFDKLSSDFKPARAIQDGAGGI